MWNYIKKLFSKKEIAESYKLEEVKNGWKKYKDPLQMPFERALALQTAELGLDWNLSKSQLIEVLDKIIESVSAKDISNAVVKLSALKEKVSLILTKDVLIEICCIFFLHPEEPAADYSQDWQIKKREILKKDIALSNFFLQIYMKECLNLKEQLAIDFQNYFFQTLKEVKTLEKILGTQKSS